MTKSCLHWQCSGIASYVNIGGCRFGKSTIGSPALAATGNSLSVPFMVRMISIAMHSIRLWSVPRCGEDIALFGHGVRLPENCTATQD